MSVDGLTQASGNHNLIYTEYIDIKQTAYDFYTDKGEHATVLYQPVRT